MIEMRNVAAAAIVAALCAQAGAQTAMGTAFTYQARLSDAGALTTMDYDLRFKLFNNNGEADQTTGQIGADNVRDDVPVTQGLFSVVLDFGAVFTGQKRWLQIEVRPGDSSGAYTTLLPRVEITGTPYANGLELPFAAQQVPAGGANIFSITTDDARAGLFRNTLASTNFVALRAESGGNGGGLHALMNSGGNGFAGWFQSLNPATTVSTLKAETFGMGQAGEFRIQSGANPGASLYAATAGTGPAVLADGRLQIGSAATSGSVAMQRAGSANDVLTMAAGVNGGALTLLSTGGVPVLEAFNDTNSPAGQLSIARGAGNAGFIVDGNFAGLGDPLVYIAGASRTAIFNLAGNADASVQLPADAIAAPEMLDEPGIAENNSDASIAVVPGSLVSLISRTLTPPAEGYCFVIGTAQVSVLHSQGSVTQVSLGVSPAADAFPPTQDVGLILPASLPSGNYTVPVTVHGVFPVSPDETTFHLLCETGPVTPAQVFDLEITACYFPTAYGPVGPTFRSGGNGSDRFSAVRAPQSAGEIAAERQSAATANNSRVARELARMQAEIDALKAIVTRDHAAARRQAPPLPASTPAEAPTGRDEEPVARKTNR